MSPNHPRALRGLLAVLLAVLLPASLLATPSAADVPGGSIVSDNPANFTPDVLDGRVYSVIKVGDTIILGGTFTRASNAGSDNELTRNRVLAFDANTGEIRENFAPDVDGTVRVVLPTGDGSTIYVGGDYDTINGEDHGRLARVRLSDGEVVDSFDAGGITGSVRDLRLKDGRLWMAGAFTHVQGSAHPALATVNPSTGSVTSYASLDVEGTQNGGYTTVGKIDISPDGSRLVGVGNFATVGGQDRRQLFQLDLSGPAAALSDFKTDFYKGACSNSFNSYMRDVDFSPGGDFFVVTTTGAYRGSTSPCDATARWETDAVGTNVDYSWLTHTGGDTLYAVEVTEDTVYVGGHFRWQNNSYAGDQAGPGAVSRPGLAALDPINGLPLSWNPGRTRGVGVFDFLHTDKGLWAVSDTDRWGAYEYHGRVALFPSAGGTTYPAQQTPQLPGTVYLGDGGGLESTQLDNGGATPPVDAPDGPQDWGNAKGAFMLGNEVFLTRSDGSFVRHTFDGEDWGPAVPIDTGDQLVEMAAWDTNVTKMTGMFNDQGRIYYTQSDANRLDFRYFTPESDMVGARPLTSITGAEAGIDFRNVRGMFLAGSRMYYSDQTGVLRSIQWERGGASGRPVPGTIRVESGLTDGVNWSSNALFVGPDPGAEPNEAPTARIASISCADLTCTFDGSTSGDPDGSVASYEWDFGDGDTGSGATTQHTYASPGQRDVSLTVTDDDGATDSAQGQANPADPAAGDVVSLVGTDGYADAGNNHQVTIPAGVQAGDTLLLHATVNTNNATLGDPAGWTELSSPAGGNMQGRAWTRTATASDAGSTVSVSTSGWVKVELSLGAYRGDGGASLAVLDHAGVFDGQDGTDHVSPGVSSSESGSWLVTSWVAKKSDDVTWDIPASQQRRETGTGAAGGRLNGVMADSNGPVPTGQTGGLTGTTNLDTSRVVMFSTVIGPA